MNLTTSAVVELTVFSVSMISLVVLQVTGHDTTQISTFLTTLSVAVAGHATGRVGGSGSSGG